MTQTTRKAVLFAVIGVFLAAGYGLLLYAVTEPWRVYGNDYRSLFWTIPAFLVAASIAIVAVRFPRTWFLVLLLVPLFLVSRQLIINQHLKVSIISCGNHSAFWPPVAFDANKTLRASIEFTDFLVATDYYSEPVDRLLPGKRCPGFRRVGRQTGVVFVGGGLRPASLQDAEVLIAFCSWQSHPIPYDHQHCLVWWPSGEKGTNWGSFHRECSNTTNMIARIETALIQADEGIVPYSTEARRVLAYELEQRKQLKARGK
jgi:hypothetical protein